MEPLNESNANRLRIQRICYLFETRKWDPSLFHKKTNSAAVVMGLTGRSWDSRRPCRTVKLMRTSPINDGYDLIDFLLLFKAPGCDNRFWRTSLSVFDLSKFIQIILSSIFDGRRAIILNSQSHETKVVLGIRKPKTKLWLEQRFSSNITWLVMQKLLQLINARLINIVEIIHRIAFAAVMLFDDRLRFGHSTFLLQFKIVFFRAASTSIACHFTVVGVHFD